ncbi:MAG: S26 family signal peptidase [Mediterranea sp.]|jgi:signal peptidase I|nr:S26 family signal peptidase [Mediterranea sp.]
MKVRPSKWILTLAGAVVVVLLLRTFGFMSCLIPDAGMERTILRGERILVNRWSYGLRTPFTSPLGYHRWLPRPVGRQDVVVFNNPHPTDTHTAIDHRDVYIGRCAALPGDTLWGDSIFSPLVIPARGRFVAVTPRNRALLCYTLVAHEGRRAELRGDTLYVDGKPATVCRFDQDYYWMSSNNPLNPSSSHLFGLVPYSHIIGRASLVWFSKEEGSGWLNGYRWERMFQSIK